MKIKWSILFILLCVILIFFGYRYYLYKSNLESNKPYVRFTSLIKEGEYGKAYSYLYPFVEKNDEKAMQLIAHAYKNKGYGVDIDLIKSNIWEQRSKSHNYMLLGEVEYNQAENFLEKNKYNMASLYFQKSAELGYKEAILKLKDQNFIEKNRISVDRAWKEYWGDFDYDKLYPDIK